LLTGSVGGGRAAVHRASDPLRAGAGRLAVPACALLQRQRLQHLQPELRVRRAEELPRCHRQRDLSAHARQYSGVHHQCANHRPLARQDRRHAADAGVPRPWRRPRARRAAVGGASVAGDDSLAVDVRFALQRHQLDADRGRAGRRRQPAAMAGPGGPGHDRRGSGARLRLFPFGVVIFLAGFTSVPKDVLDAATVDGAGFWRRNYQIILPIIAPIVLIALIFGTVFTFTDLSVVYLLTKGGPINSTQVLGTYAFQVGIL